MQAGYLNEHGVRPSTVNKNARWHGSQNWLMDVEDWP